MRRRIWQTATVIGAAAVAAGVVLVLYVAVAAAAETSSAQASGTQASSTGTTASPSPSLSPSPNAVSFNGTAAVGALFLTTNGKLHHFCTAAVVPSPGGNLVITAAHCVRGRKLGSSGGVIFAPGYHNGVFPYGRWTVMSEFVDSAWQKHQDPNNDVAFLVVRQGKRKIQRYTGADAVATSVKLPLSVTVLGYPDDRSLPVECRNKTRLVHPQGLNQLVFDCSGYTDGTSGGPFLMHFDTKTGQGVVVGVIGGYQQGGDLPNVSYSSQFLKNVAALYKQATS
jgi:V8-like Glu-specific endopeptidase